MKKIKAGPWWLQAANGYPRSAWRLHLCVTSTRIDNRWHIIVRNSRSHQPIPSKDLGELRGSLSLVWFEGDEYSGSRYKYGVHTAATGFGRSTFMLSRVLYLVALTSKEIFSPVVLMQGDYYLIFFILSSSLQIFMFVMSHQLAGTSQAAYSKGILIFDRWDTPRKIFFNSPKNSCHHCYQCTSEN